MAGSVSSSNLDTFTRPLGSLCFAGVRALETGGFSYPLESSGGMKSHGSLRAPSFGMRAHMEKVSSERAKASLRSGYAGPQEGSRGRLARRWRTISTMYPETSGQHDLLSDREGSDNFQRSLCGADSESGRPALFHERSCCVQPHAGVLQPRVIELSEHDRPETVGQDAPPNHWGGHRGGHRIRAFIPEPLVDVREGDPGPN